jgi:flagellar biosynthesis protein FlhB
MLRVVGLAAIGAVRAQARSDPVNRRISIIVMNRRWAAPARLVQGGLLLLLAALAAFALVDVPLQRWLLLRRLRMSHEELKKETKEVEGNPRSRAEKRACARWPPPHAGRGAARRPGGDEPDPLRGGAEVRRRQ